MKGEDHLEIVLNYTHNIVACQSHGSFFPDIIGTITMVQAEGFYNKNWEKISEQLFLEGRTEILQIISLRSLNILELKKILGYSYPTIYRYATGLKKLKLVKFIEGTSKKGKRELKLSIHENVEIRHLTKGEKDINKQIEKQKEISEDNLREFESWLSGEITKISSQPTIKRSVRKSAHRHK